MGGRSAHKATPPGLIWVIPVKATGDAAPLDIVSIRSEGKTLVVAINPTSKPLDLTATVAGKSLPAHFEPFAVHAVR